MLLFFNLMGSPSSPLTSHLGKTALPHWLRDTCHFSGEEALTLATHPVSHVSLTVCCTVTSTVCSSCRGQAQSFPENLLHTSHSQRALTSTTVRGMDPDTHPSAAYREHWLTRLVCEVVVVSRGNIMLSIY